MGKLWKWIRIPKGIALLAFLLPWLTVRCSGQTLVEASGYDLAFAHAVAAGKSAMSGKDVPPDMASINYWLILALLAIAIGLLLLFLRGREAARLVLGTSVMAFVSILIGTHRYSKAALLAGASQQHGDGGMDTGAAAAMAMIQVDWQIGYWLTLLALAAAGVMAALIVLDKDGRS